MPRPKHRTAFAADLLRAVLIIIGWLSFFAGAAIAADEPKPAAAAGRVELLLEVFINGYSTNLIARFVELPDGSLVVSRDTLDELDLVIADSAGADVRLDRVSGLSFQYDRAKQAVQLRVPERMRKAKVYEAKRAAAQVEQGQTHYAALVNYSLYASAMQGLSSRTATGPYGGFNGANLSLSGRFTTPLGNLYQSGLVGTVPSYKALQSSPVSDVNALRYDTMFAHVDPDSFMTYQFGDVVSGGLSWTQPLRMGGIQVQRNFSARPDIVTQALPSFSGSAAAPSSVDVFVNGVKTYSQQVAAGPFQLSNVPTVGGGEARIVVRDASGKEVETKVPFYAAPTLLRPGVYEASAEGGFARYNFGTTSNDYGSSPIGSVSLRGGITDNLTGESHLEGGVGLINGGVGLVASIADRAIVTGAVSASYMNGRSGLQLYGSLDTRVGPVGVHLQSSRGLGRYSDLSIATAKLRPTTADEEARAAASGASVYYLPDYRPIVSRDQVSVSLPIAFDRSSVSATYVRSEPESGAVTQIVSLSYSRPFIAKSSLFATAFADLAAVSSLGAYIGVSMPLGDVAVSAGVNKTHTGTSASVDASKPLGSEPGNWGYRARDSEGDLGSRSAAISHRTETARLEAGVQQDDSSVQETFTASGSVVAMGGGVYFANTIDDGFAVVNAGAPGVRVMAENRFVGETDSRGTLLVPNLRSNQKNNLGIDPTNLPINAEVDDANQQVVPSFRGGVFVDFKVRREGTSAIVVLKKANGSFVEAGSTGRLSGGGETFLVGFDGQAFVKGLQPQNTVVVTLDKGECKASFGFLPQADKQVVIGPVACE